MASSSPDAGFNQTSDVDEKLNSETEYSPDEGIYEVEKILGISKQEGKTVYRVRWKGYGSDDDTWEPRDNLLTCEDMVEEFLEKQKDIRKRKAVSERKQGRKKQSRGSKKGRKGPPVQKSKELVDSSTESSSSTYSSSSFTTTSTSSSSSSSSSPVSNDDEELVPEAMRKEEEKMDEGERRAMMKNMEEGCTDRAALLRDPFWHMLEKGQISFSGDMYSKVKSRRATLDAKKRQQKDEVKQKSRERRRQKKDRRDRKPKRHHKKKNKSKSVIDLDVFGSLESATQKTLSMSQSVLDRSENSANLFRSSSLTNSEEIITVAKLEEKSRMSSSPSHSDTVQSPTGFSVSPTNLSPRSDGDSTISNFSTVGAEMNTNDDQDRPVDRSNLNKLPSEIETSAQVHDTPSAQSSAMETVAKLPTIPEQSEIPKKEQRLSDWSIDKVLSTNTQDQNTDSLVAHVHNLEQDLANKVNLNTEPTQALSKSVGPIALATKPRVVLPQEQNEGTKLPSMATMSSQHTELPLLNVMQQHSVPCPEVSPQQQTSPTTLYPDMDFMARAQQQQPDTRMMMDFSGTSQTAVGMQQTALGTQSQLLALEMEQQQRYELDARLAQHHRRGSKGSPTSEAFQKASSSSKDHEDMVRHSKGHHGVDKGLHKAKWGQDREMTGDTGGGFQINAEIRDKYKHENQNKCQRDVIVISSDEEDVKKPRVKAYSWDNLSGWKFTFEEDMYSKVKQRRASFESKQNIQSAAKLDKAPKTSSVGAEELGKPGKHAEKCKAGKHKDSSGKMKNHPDRSKVKKSRKRQGSSDFEFEFEQESPDAGYQSPTRDEMEAPAYVSDVTSSQDGGKNKSEVQDPFWENLARGTLTFEGDMYSKVKQRRAKKREQGMDKLGSLNSSQPLKTLVGTVTSSQDGGKNKSEVQDPFWENLARGTLTFEGDMYSKVKQRRAKKREQGMDKLGSLNSSQPLKTLVGTADLQRAVLEGKTHIVKAAFMMNLVHNLEQPDVNGATLLMHACSSRNDELLKLLIMQGASVNACTKNGMTPLMYVSEQGYASAAGILLEAGGFVNFKQPATGDVSLIKASRRGHVEVVQVLLDYGANWSLANVNNTTAENFARLNNHFAVQDILNTHIKRMTKELELVITQYMSGTAELIKPLFPLHCIRVREACEHNIYLYHELNQYSYRQGFGNLLFLGHATMGPGGTNCRLTGPCFVREVFLNGQLLPQLNQGSNFIVSLPLRHGHNLVKIRTVRDPSTNTIILVGGYSMQVIMP